jgi:hypothetical protein
METVYSGQITQQLLNNQLCFYWAQSLEKIH